MSVCGSAPYRLVILGRDIAWAAELQKRVTTAVTEVVQRLEAITFERELGAPGDPAAARPQVVVVVLADASSRDDADLTEALESARHQMLAVLPLTRAGAIVEEILPPLLRPLNALVWDGHEADAVMAIMRLLGLVEQERRLFLSYRRQETSALALQLRTRLSERGYDVFLDRFSVPPADDFQRRIDIELADKAFVLLLESPAAVGSQWVQHEVAYALSHGIALLALSLPETRDEDRFGVVDDAFRRPLPAADLAAPNGGGLSDRLLRDDPLAAVLDAIELEYARRLRLRRKALLGSLELWLGQSGAPPAQTTDEWALVADWPDAWATVFLITPRAPSPRDLWRLDDLRGTHEQSCGRSVHGCLAYASAVQDDDNAALVRWIVDGRPLATVLHDRVPDLLALP